MFWKWIFGFFLWIATLCVACEGPLPVTEERSVAPRAAQRLQEELSLDPRTGIPYATVFDHPVDGFDTSDYGFGFGDTNQWFCMKTAPDGSCISYGAHLGRDTLVPHTPVKTEVHAPADGIVRVTTDIRFGGYGSDSTANRSYDGCVVVLEHLLGNGQAVTTLLGHLECDSGPAVGTLVARGDVVGRVGHYWHGAGTSTDWHHVHWAMRSGRFSATRYAKTDLGPYVQGYAPSSEFKIDSQTNVLTHPLWLDPFVVIAANGDSDAQADARVRFHPPGSFLKDASGTYWLVTDETHIAVVPPGTARSDRYPTDHAIPISSDELDCYDRASDVASYGPVTLYVRPGTNAVVMAYDLTKERYDVINWETFLSWGLREEDIVRTDDVFFYEETYQDNGFRLLRPGTLVKANESSEVSIVTAQQTRLPIVSEEVFERAGFQWNLITSVPESVITDVAGPRENRVLTEADLEHCAVPLSCPGGGVCGGGGLEPEESEPMTEPVTVLDASTPLPTPVPVPPSTPPVVPATPPSFSSTPALAIDVMTTADMSDFSVWFEYGSVYATPEETEVDCALTNQSAFCVFPIDLEEPLEFWMYTGIPNTPWSPGLNWETDACDPFADVAVTLDGEPLPLQMKQIGDGCRFVVSRP